MLQKVWGTILMVLNTQQFNQIIVLPPTEFLEHSTTIFNVHENESTKMRLHVMANELRGCWVDVSTAWGGVFQFQIKNLDFLM